MEHWNNIAAEVAEILLDIQAVILRPNEPFTWASGIKSPIYCDNRLLLSYPKRRDFIEGNLLFLASSDFAEAEVIAGVATAGIPHASILADRMEMPLCYVRAKKKEHGTGSQIEGRLEQGQKVLMVEDLISTGKSSLEAVEALREAGAEVLGVVAIFSYGFASAKEAFEQAGVPYTSLSDYENLLQKALEKDYITEDQLEVLKKWREDPQNWGSDLEI